MSDLTVVAGTRRTMKEMADGTIRVQIDIDPPHREAFLRLFGEINMAVGLAPLTIGPTPDLIEAETAAHRKSLIESGRVKGGLLAKWAGILSNDPQFKTWLWDVKKWGRDPAEYIRAACCVDSRAELDHRPLSGGTFREVIMKPFNEWKEAQKCT